MPNADSAASPGVKLTPMLEQYLRIKQEHPDALLFFRLGDFYELFFADAERASRLLEITLTTRSKKDEVPVPMCGVPYHAVQSYIAKLLANGLKVALCDQMEDASLAKGIVNRAVVRVLTPGTVTEEELLDPKRPNYLAAVAVDGPRAAVVYADLSTGELRHVEAATRAELLDALARLGPVELLVDAGADELAGTIVEAIPALTISRLPPTSFDIAVASAWLTEAGAPTAPAPMVQSALGAVLRYLADTHRASLVHLRPLESDVRGAQLLMDEATRRHLELLTTTRGERRGSLLWVLDQTETPMGGRLLRHWMLTPLTDVTRIAARLDAVEELVEQPTLRQRVRQILGTIGDLERLTARLAAHRVTPRDLQGLAAGLAAAGRVGAAFAGARAGAIVEAVSALDPLPAVQARIAMALTDDPPLNPRAGDVIRTGFDARVDELRGLAREGKRFIGELETRERARSGIASLKVRYNQVFGYYIEVTKPNLGLIPADYRRKQTVANAERFITPELQEYEAKILGAEERLTALQAELFEQLVVEVAAQHAALARTAGALACLDVLSALALVAERHQYTRPQLTQARRLVIEAGRHPVVELMAGRSGFVPNDCELGPEEKQIVVLTGPNMAGKSTYLRQTALIVLLAQMGGFVPAGRAEVGIVDRLFTRIGASDNLSGGESTFMVEMKETAHIIHELTDRSLVVLDEIGRGTSTFDGISIAWAVAEHLHDAPERPLVLFATHYHELTDLARMKERVHNFSVAVQEWKGEVLFLRRIVPGAASQSYGIQVARLAGVPDAVIRRAQRVALVRLLALGRKPGRRRLPGAGLAGLGE